MLDYHEAKKTVTVSTAVNGSENDVICTFLIHLIVKCCLKVEILTLQPHIELLNLGMQMIIYHEVISRIKREITTDYGQID